MAVVQLRTGRTDLTLAAQAGLSVVPPEITDIPGGLYPLHLTVYTTDDWRMKYGWPTEIPSLDVRAIGLVSAEGEVLGNRLSPTQIKTNATVRWLADNQYYSEGELAWFPFTAGTDLRWYTSTDYAPAFIDNYTYRVGSEVFIMNALNFDSDTRSHMWTNTAGVLSLTGYTLIMVMSPNSFYGNTVDLPYSGIWCDGGPPPVGEDTFVEDINHYMNVTLQGNYLYLETDQTIRVQTLGVAQFLSGNSPLFLAMTLTRPTAKLYASLGGGTIQMVSTPTGDVPQPLDPSLVLGRSTGDVLHTADMALFDLGLYLNPLSDTEIAAEFALLSQVYGGAS